MIVICPTCRLRYDDARCDTGCLHRPFLSDRDLAQKDLALSLIGHDICFAHAPEGARYSICSVDFTGMVELRGDQMVGKFAPHLFVVAKNKG